MELTIKIKVKDVEVELSLDEARKLKSFLEGVTVEKQEVIVALNREYWPYSPYWPWSSGITWTYGEPVRVTNGTVVHTVPQ
jgi:sulfur carrier protein ThiS